MPVGGEIVFGLGEVAVKITANINEFKANLQEAHNKLEGFGKNIKTTSDHFATVWKVAGVAGAAVAAGLGYAVKTAADFDSQMSKVKALSGATQDEFNALRDAAIDLGSSQYIPRVKQPKVCQSWLLLALTANR
jgi:hypothetical protein